MNYEIDYSNDNDSEYHSNSFSILVGQDEDIFIKQPQEDLELDSVIDELEIDETDYTEDFPEIDDDDIDIEDEHEEDDFNIEDDDEEDDDELIEEETIALEIASYNSLLEDYIDELQQELDDI